MFFTYWLNGVRQAAAHQQGGHLGVGRKDPVAQEVVDELLREAADLHVGVHVDVLHQEAVGLHHLLHGNHVRMDLAPGEGFDGAVQVVRAGAGRLQHGSRGEAGAGVAVVLDLDMRVLLLDAGHDLADLRRTADAGHILEADFIGAVFDQLLHHTQVVFHRVDRGVGDGQGSLRNHAGFLGIFDGKLEVAVVVQAAEGAGDVGALCLFHLEHQFADVRRNGVHADGVEAAFQHMGLDARLAEGSRPLAHGDVRVLAVEQVHLLEGAAVGFHAVEAAHVHDGRSHPYQLVHARLIPAGTLPHVPVNQGELDFTFCHIGLFVNLRIHKCSNNSWILCL